MNAIHSSRAAVCGGAIVLALGAGMVVVPAAGATTLGTGLLGGSTSGGTGALGSTASVVPATVAAPVTGTVGAVTPAVGAVTGDVVTTVSTSTSGASDPLVSTRSDGGSTTIGVLDGGNGSLATVTLGTTGSSDGTGASSGAAASGTATDAVSDVLSGLLGDQDGGTTAGGSGGGTGAVQVDVQLGGSGQSEVAAPVPIPSIDPTSTGQEVLPTPAAAPTASAPMVTDTVPAPVTAVVPGGPVSTSVPDATPTPALTLTPPAVPAPDASAVKARLLSLRAAPSLATIYPAKDGYRDDVVFHLRSVTSTGKNLAVEGDAVLKRGTRQVAHWTIGRSTQDLHWNGLVGGKVVSGAYALVATLTDAAGGTHTATSKVAVSAKKLVPATTRLTAFAVSGKHAMAAAPRSGLSKGAVTARITTVATRVTGKQSLIFVKGRQRIVVPIKLGTHTSRLITIPRTFTSFTVRHTWKKGQVALKSVETTYSYQTLR